MDITRMTNQEIIDFLRTRDRKVSIQSIGTDIENVFKQNGIEFVCPVCGSVNRVKNGKNRSGLVRYKCKDCGTGYTVETNTIFEGTDYSWDEMVNAVYYVITKQSVEYIMMNVKQTPILKANAWLLQHKILHLLAQFPLPKLHGIIQIDEKYLRENQKGSRELVSFLDSKKTRRARRHNYRSEAGIFGPEFINVLCAVDDSGTKWAMPVCLGPMGMEELEQLTPYLDDVSYICTDNYAVYTDWTINKGWKHYVEPSTYRKERQSRGYINTDNVYQTLSDADYKKDRAINEQLYKEGRYPHIENTDRKLTYDECVALKYKFNLNINAVNSFHGRLEQDLITDKTGVATNYVADYVGAYVYLENYRNIRKKTTFTKQDAEYILLQMCEKTLKDKHSPTREEILGLNIDSLPRPTAKVIADARKRMKEARAIIKIEKDEHDKSEYEGDDTNAQYMFNKYMFFNSIGAIRLNELIKQNGLYRKGMLKKEKVKLMCNLPNAQDIIFYEVYLHRYGSIDEFTKAINALPAKKKRGRPKKN